MPGAIDIVINLHTPEVLPLRPDWYGGFLGGKIGADTEITKGFPIEKYLERMDRAGIQMAFITAAKSGSKGHPSNWQLPYEMVADVVKKHPTRFKGLAGLDPYEGDGGRSQAGVRDQRAALQAGVQRKTAVEKRRPVVRPGGPGWFRPVVRERVKLGLQFCRERCVDEAPPSVLILSGHAIAFSKGLKR